jgi:uncharacterized protein
MQTKPAKTCASIRFHSEEAKTIFNDPLMVTFTDEEHSQQEERLISIGVSAKNKLLLVVHLEREETAEYLLIRLISCRRATHLEQKAYEEN